MFINRRTITVVPGKQEELIERLKEVGAKLDWPGNARVSTTHTGRFDELIIESEFDSLAQYEAFWNAWFVSDHAAAFIPFWREATLPGGTNELYEMAFEIIKGA